MTDHHLTGYARLTLLQRLCLRLQLRWHESQANHYRDYVVPSTQDKVNRGVESIDWLMRDKHDLRHHETRAREIRERLAIG